jgi:hypothetical protein
VEPDWLVNKKLTSWAFEVAAKKIKDNVSADLRMIVILLAPALVLHLKQLD